MKTRLLPLVLLGSALSLSAAPVLVDFGSAATKTQTADGKVWNNVDDQNQRTLAGLPLLDTSGAQSGIQLTIESPFSGANRNGSKESLAGYPVSAVNDSLYANIELFAKQENVTPVLRLSGLDPAKRYTLTFFASRIASDNRSTRYTVTGADSTSAELDAASKEVAPVSAGPLAPRPDGSLSIVISPAAANNNANHFTYLGVLEIHPAE